MEAEKLNTPGGHTIPRSSFNIRVNTLAFLFSIHV